MLPALLGNEIRDCKEIGRVDIRRIDSLRNVSKRDENKHEYN